MRPSKVMGTVRTCFSSPRTPSSTHEITRTLAPRLPRSRGTVHLGTRPFRCRTRPRGDQGWKDRQDLLNKRAAEAGEKAQVVFIGDSITQGWEGEGKEVWAKYYAHRNAVNLGIGGDRTQHVLWRFDNGNLNGDRKS